MPEEATVAQQENKRILVLAQAGTMVKTIALRLGTTYDRVRRQIERAEGRGEVPAGTLAKCGIKSRQKAKTEDEPARLICAYAPQRKVAADMGHCSLCSSPTEIAVDLHLSNVRQQFRLCRAHAPELVAALNRALSQAAASRNVFNGPIG